MTAAAAVVVAAFLFLLFRQVLQRRDVAELRRRVSNQVGAEQAVERAVRLGLMNPPPRRRWVRDRKDVDRPVPRVLHDMTRH